MSYSTFFRRNWKGKVGDRVPVYMEQEISWYTVLHFRVIDNDVEIAVLHTYTLFGLVGSGLIAVLPINLCWSMVGLVRCCRWVWFCAVFLLGVTVLQTLIAPSITLHWFELLYRGVIAIFLTLLLPEICNLKLRMMETSIVSTWPGLRHVRVWVAVCINKNVAGCQ